MTITEQEKENLLAFSKILGIEFKNLDLLQESLRHRSYLNEIKDPHIMSNERLEFLGDAVLELSTTRSLFQKYPNRAEGDLTSFRAALVRTESLAETALSLKYSDYLYMSKGEEATGGRTRPYILANTYEAVLGAIYLDQGFAAADEFITKTLLPKLEAIVRERLDIDNKSKFQEIAQERVKITPTYRVIDETGPDHLKKFKIEVLLGDQSYGEGIGSSKQEAEQNAAATALENWSEKN